LSPRNAEGSVGTEMPVMSYNWNTTPAGMNVPSQPLGVPAGARWAGGMRVWANPDKSRGGTPLVYYSDTVGERALQTSGDCAAGGRQDSWGDSGAPGRNVVYTLRCTSSGTGVGTDTGGGTGGSEGGGTAGPTPGESAPTGTSVLINRRSGNCID
ncbi:galactose oxidase, partial [Chryseobacterium phosphatilyticum]